MGRSNREGIFECVSLWAHALLYRVCHLLMLYINLHGLL